MGPVDRVRDRELKFKPMREGRNDVERYFRHRVTIAHPVLPMLMSVIFKISKTEAESAHSCGITSLAVVFSDCTVPDVDDESEKTLRSIHNLSTAQFFQSKQNGSLMQLIYFDSACKPSNLPLT